MRLDPSKWHHGPLVVKGAVQRPSAMSFAGYSLGQTLGIV